MSVPLLVPHRNYVKRKRHLNESVDLIKRTLECLASVRGEPMNSAEISRQALARALEIEAACWNSLRRPANEEYNRVMMAKTREVCMALITNAIAPRPDANFVRSVLAGVRPPNRVTLPPVPEKTGFQGEQPDDLFPQFATIDKDGGMPPYEPGSAALFKFDI
jgi:hypothetical protein